MEDKNCARLLEYLRSILYDPRIERLELEELDEPYRNLGRGMQFLQHAVEEMLDYSKELSKGNLSKEFPGRDNFLCVNLKNMHANLNHLTWQAKQVASGDYSQEVSYLGEFSEAFNTMTAQLKEREEQLRQEAVKMKKRVDITEKKLEEAYYDPVSSIYNRMYFEEYMDKVIKEKKTVTLCYLDLDGLKYVNDNYGHPAGDEYIQSFVRLIQYSFRRSDEFARIGGDEFCLILEGNLEELAEKKLEKVREKFILKNKKEYPVSFSYGVYVVDGSIDGLTLHKVILEADLRMYEYKRKNKKERK